MLMILLLVTAPAVVATTAGSCSDTSGDASGQDGYTCDGWTAEPEWCDLSHYYDDSDFTATVMCCACGGGGAAEACDEYLVVSGSSLHTSVMGVYVQTGVMQSGRPVYEISGPSTAYLYFIESLDDWNIGPSYLDDSVMLHSYGSGADASCPVDVPTWKHWDGATETWEVADGITVVAQILVPTPAPTTLAPTPGATPGPTPAVTLPTPAPSPAATPGPTPAPTPAPLPPALACASHQWYDKANSKCEQCPDGKEPSHDKLACEEETIGGLSDIHIAAIASALSMCGMGGAGAAFFYRMVKARRCGPEETDMPGPV